MKPGELLHKLVPGSAKKKLRQVIRQEASGVLPTIQAHDVITALYTPPEYLDPRSQASRLTWSGQKTPRRRPDDPLPIPPRQLRMEHSDDDQEYLARGAYSAQMIRRILNREKAPLADRDALLDWGCATGRVLRHFVEEAKRGEVWGADQHGSSILWAKENLAPPFKFLTCTAYPHLPFEDGKFKLIYAESVLTHFVHLIDLWLMELRRILAPGGFALLTIHDENTWRLIGEDETLRKFWVAHGWLGSHELGKSLEHDVVAITSGPSWDHVITFFKTDYVKREWGNYLDVVSFEPAHRDFYQTVVVLRKRG